MQVTIRSGDTATRRGRGSNVLIGVYLDRPIVWNRTGNYRWDGAPHPLDLVSDLPPWQELEAF